MQTIVSGSVRREVILIQRLVFFMDSKFYRSQILSLGKGVIIKFVGLSSIRTQVFQK